MPKILMPFGAGGSKSNIFQTLQQLGGSPFFLSRCLIPADELRKRSLPHIIWSLRSPDEQSTAESEDLRNFLD